MADEYLIQGRSAAGYGPAGYPPSVSRRDPIRVLLANGDVHLHAQSWQVVDESLGLDHVQREHGSQSYEVGASGELVVSYQVSRVSPGNDQHSWGGRVKVYAPGAWVEVEGLDQTNRGDGPGVLVPAPGWWAVLGRRHYDPVLHDAGEERQAAVLGWERVGEGDAARVVAWLAAAPPVRADRVREWSVTGYVQEQPDSRIAQL